MKMNILNKKTFLFIGAICITILFFGVNSTENKNKNKERIHHKQDFKISI